MKRDVPALHFDEILGHVGIQMIQQRVPAPNTSAVDYPDRFCENLGWSETGFEEVIVPFCVPSKFSKLNKLDTIVVLSVLSNFCYGTRNVLKNK